MPNSPYTIHLTVRDGFLVVRFYPAISAAECQTLFQAVNTTMSREEASQFVKEFAANTNRLTVIETQE